MPAMISDKNWVTWRARVQQYLRKKWESNSKLEEVKAIKPENRTQMLLLVNVASFGNPTSLEKDDAQQKTHNTWYLPVYGSNVDRRSNINITDSQKDTTNRKYGYVQFLFFFLNNICDNSFPTAVKNDILCHFLFVQNIINIKHIQYSQFPSLPMKQYMLEK